MDTYVQNQISQILFDMTCHVNKIRKIFPSFHMVVHKGNIKYTMNVLGQTMIK